MSDLPSKLSSAGKERTFGALNVDLDEIGMSLWIMSQKTVSCEGGNKIGMFPG